MFNRKRDNATPPPRALLKDAPDAASPAEYVGARLCADGAVVMGWSTTCGLIDVIYPYWVGTPRPEALSESAVTHRANLPSSWKQAIDPDVATVVIGPGFRANYGPEVTEHVPGGDTSALWWRDLVRLLGRPVPYWPGDLQDVETLLSWRPGDASVDVDPIPQMDVDPLLRLAATLSPETASWKAVMILVRAARSSHSAETSLNDVRETKDGGADLFEFPVLPKATPPAPLSGLSDDARLTMRVGWRDICERGDGLARAAVRAAEAYDVAPLFFPYSYPVDLGQDHRFHTEISARLTPSMWTAGHQRALQNYWFESGDDTAMWDPVTDTPAVITHDGEVRLVSPHGTLTPIEQVILAENHEVWMRTADGDIIPPVQTWSGNMTYGYSGGGTAAFERFLLAWLKTATPHASDADRETYTNALASITDHPWKPGTTITRGQVQRVLDGEPADQVII